MNADHGTISLIELHDARVAVFRLQMGGQADLDFTHLVVFLQVEKEEYDVWSFSAQVQVRGVRYVELAGELARDDRVSDARFTDENGSVLTWQQLIATAPTSRIVLDFSSGAKITLDCETAHIALLERARFLERWTGPLIAEDS